MVTKDLDWSNVFDDARRMEVELGEDLYSWWSGWPTEALLHQRYLSGIVARGASGGTIESGIDEVIMINWILAER